MHHHVQAVTVLEATHPENNPVHKSSTIKRNVYKDSNNNNNNVQQITKTKESLNVAATSNKATPTAAESTDYTLLGLVTFKSPIKWLNTISIILIHLILVFGFFTYPLHKCIRTTLWGKSMKFKYLVHITNRTYSRKIH